MLQDEIEAYFTRLLNEYLQNKKMNQIKIDVDFSNKAASDIRGLRMTDKLKECLAIMDDDSFTNSYRVAKIAQVSVAFKLQSGVLRSGMTRGFITLDHWRHIVLSVMLVSGQSLSFLFAPLMLFYETCKFALFMWQFCKHRYLLSPTALFLEMSQSILMITELVTMCIVSLAPGNHFVLSMACIILIVSLIAIQVICTFYIFVKSAIYQIKDILRQRRIRKLITMINLHLEIKTEGPISHLGNRLRRNLIRKSRQLNANKIWMQRLVGMNSRESQKESDQVILFSTEVNNSKKVEK